VLVDLDPAGALTPLVGQPQASPELVAMDFRPRHDLLDGHARAACANGLTPLTRTARASRYVNLGIGIPTLVLANHGNGWFPPRRNQSHAPMTT
jgi:hypothetical protein